MELIIVVEFVLESDDMAFKLPPELEEKFRAARAVEDGYKAVFANLDNEDLVASARFWMAHCAAPRHVTPGSPVYDATFWHIIVPELMRRLAK